MPFIENTSCQTVLGGVFGKNVENTTVKKPETKAKVDFLSERANILSKMPARNVGSKKREKANLLAQSLTQIGTEGGTINFRMTYPPLLILLGVNLYCINTAQISMFPCFHITEVTKSQCNRRRQRRLQIFLKNFTFEAWIIHVK